MPFLSRHIILVRTLALPACRQELAHAGGMTAEKAVLQGLYQRTADGQFVSNCLNGQLTLLQDTPKEELRRQCSLFDNPTGTVLWLDLEGEWRERVFVLHRINRIERRQKEAGCEG